MHSPRADSTALQWVRALVVGAILFPPGLIYVNWNWNLSLTPRGMLESVLIAFLTTAVIAVVGWLYARRLVVQGRHPLWARVEDIRLQRPIIVLFGVYFFVWFYVPVSYGAWLRLTAVPVGHTYTVTGNGYRTGLSRRGCWAWLTVDESESPIRKRFCADELDEHHSVVRPGRRLRVLALENSRAAYVLDLALEPQ